MELPRGMKDFDSDEMRKIEYVREIFLDTAKTFGFDLMEPSPIELLSTLEAKSGPSIRDEIYQFKDKCQDRFQSQKSRHAAINPDIQPTR